MDIVNIFSSGQSEAEKDMLTTTKSEKQMGNLKGCAMLESAQAKRGKEWIRDEWGIEHYTGNEGQKDHP